jgi:hypothetical protein
MWASPSEAAIFCARALLEAEAALGCPRLVESEHRGNGCRPDVENFHTNGCRLGCALLREERQHTLAARLEVGDRRELENAAAAKVLDGAQEWRGAVALECGAAFALSSGGANF